MSSGSDTSIPMDGAAGGSGNAGTLAFNSTNLSLEAVVNAANVDDLTQNIVCFLNAGGNDYSGGIGVRVSSVFVVLIVSSAVTFFPVIATRSKKVRIPLFVYLFARYFGAGVIVATAFIHLLDPSYEEIGPASCVGLSPGWREYSWPPAIAMASGVLVFLMDFAAELYVEKRYGLAHGTSETQDREAMRVGSVDAGMARYEIGRRRSTHQALHSADQDPHLRQRLEQGITEAPKTTEEGKSEQTSTTESEEEVLTEKAFQQQIAAFLILEFGVIFHSVIIGLTLGSASSNDFATLYPVIVFHQSFEGMGIGARLSAIPFPKRLRWMPYALCTGYGLTTPIAIAIGLGLRTTYDSGSNTANIVSGVLDAISAGILLYTGFVELLARDFLFNPERTTDRKQLSFMVACVLLGAAIMALLGKWA